MPSRFAFYSDKETVLDFYNIDNTDIDFYEYYNVKPTNRVTGLVWEDGDLKLVRLRWGFVKGKKFFKARAETAVEKRLFGKAMRERRGLVIANGFFEWDKDKTGSTPYYFTIKDQELFTLAGLYNSYIDEEDDTRKYTTAIITVPANSVVKPVFHRMPAIIARNKIKTWLDPSTDLETIQAMLQPYDDRQMLSWEVDPLPARGDNGPDTIKKSAKSSNIDNFF